MPSPYALQHLHLGGRRLVSTPSTDKHHQKLGSALPYEFLHLGFTEFDAIHTATFVIWCTIFYESENKYYSAGVDELGSIDGVMAFDAPLGVAKLESEFIVDVTFEVVVGIVV